MGMENPATQLVLKARKLHRTLGSGTDRVHVLHGIDLSLERGRTYAIVGPSGCGKSTLLHLIGTLDEPTSGMVKLCEEDPFAMSEAELAR